MNLSYSKDQLLAALRARRAYLTSRDKRELAEHKAAEKKALAEFRAKCREALKVDYATAKRVYNGGWNSEALKIKAPNCPRLSVPMLERAIEQIERDGRKCYAVNEHGSMSTIHFLLTCDDRKPEAC